MTMILSITISERDAVRLRRLIEAGAADPADAENLQRLSSELERAHVVPETELPRDVVALNSTVELEDLEDGEVLTCTLVFPPQADARAGKISILAPLGTALLGFKVGDEIEWPVPAGTLRVRVRRVTHPDSQPVPSGDLLR